jgi:alpha-ketoglutarate-dependent taurine dioxygenase
MARKYKISESNLNEFWGLFFSKKTPEKLQKVIDTDPVLKKLKDDAKDINDKAKGYIDKLKKSDPDIYQYLQTHGFIR